MAGIGYEIRKLLDEQTFTGDLRAYFFAGIVSSGPWVVSIFCMGLLWLFSNPYLAIQYQKFLRVVVVYSFAYSLILTGVLQFVLNRFISDKLFLRQRNLLLPTYVAVLSITLVSHAIAGIVFYTLCGMDLSFSIIGVMLFMTIGCIWQTMIFLSATRDFMSITGAFFAGNLLGLFLATMEGKYTGINGYLMGYTVGQVVVLMLLVYRVFDEFYSTVAVNFSFLRYARKYSDLFFIGVFYYLALWADKILYWYSPSGEHNGALFYSHYPYDSCMFLAYLTMIPALAHFMIEIETKFYDTYRGFYGALVNRASYSVIARRKEEMTKALKGSVSGLVLLQIVITGAFICYGSDILRFLHLDQKNLVVLWTAGIGTFFHVFLLIELIIILYFDRRRAALCLSLLFLATNAGFTSYVIYFRPVLMGAGYAASTLFCSIAGALLLIYNVRNIEFLTFSEQPILRPKLPRPQVEGAARKGA